MIAQPIAIGAVLILAAALIDGTRWLVIFLPLIGLITIWIAQAVDAYNRAVRMGGERGGETAVLAVLPVAAIALTLFWLLGGRHGSPSATLQQYISSWIDDRPEAAAQLFSDGRTPDEVSADWATQSGLIKAHIDQAAGRYGVDSGLDPEHPFRNLRFGDPVTDSDGRVSVLVELVRNERVETTILGIVPTAGQQTVVVESDLRIWLDEEDQPPPSWLPFDGLASRQWKISALETL